MHYMLLKNKCSIVVPWYLLHSEPQADYMIDGSSAVISSVIYKISLFKDTDGKQADSHQVLFTTLCTRSSFQPGRRVGMKALL